MKKLLTIKDIDFGMDVPEPESRRERESARAVVFDTDGNVALLHVTKKQYHKLPGGGLEEGEDIETALRREVLEEIGCAIVNIKELGAVEEFRNKFSMRQLSHCFRADVVGEKGEPRFEADEIEEGFKPVWVSLTEAIALVEGETDVEDYEGKFIQRRDLAILKAVSASG